MAKRFADTKLTREAWYRKLSPLHKAAWRYLTDECDDVGVWAIDDDAMSFHVGDKVNLDDFVRCVNEDKKRIAQWKRKLVLIHFVDFQYGTLKEETLCKPHQRYINLLKKHTLWIPYTMGFQTLEEEEEEEEEVEEEEVVEEEEKEKVIDATHKVTPSVATRDEVRACVDEWRATLKHFEIDRGVGERDEFAISAACTRFTPEWVRLALVGARKQIKSARFDPKQFVSLSIYLHKDRIERLVNIGAGKETVDGIDWAKVFGK